jgi:hypothetical protein
MSDERDDRGLRAWLDESAPGAAPRSLYALVDSLPERARGLPTIRLLAAIGSAAVLAVVGITLVPGGGQTPPIGSPSSVGSPSPTASPSACLARLASGSAVSLAMVDPTSVTGQRLGDADKPDLPSDAPWLTSGFPAEDAVGVSPGATLSMTLSDGSRCLGPWQARALPYSDTPAASTGASPIVLGASLVSDLQTQASFAAPPAGDWVVRVDLSTEPGVAGGAARAWYFRVRVGLSGPSPYGSPVSPARPCTAEDPAGPIPELDLVTQDGVKHPAPAYGATWGGRPVGSGSWVVPSSAINLSSGAGLAITIADDVCAIEWTIIYGPPPSTGPGPDGFFPAGDLVPGVVNRDPAYASQNRFDLTPLPKGTWLIAPELGFVNGLELVVWRVTIK